ncbi:Gfo/Idh/MocA family protein [Brevibacillus sp. SYSU BS000544]|uniref:Gfo/Idh/MocA family protein n=1 Tax=Brevibacillus sp. SYSU BS000544 TaxID=3416443 RepID=UPI003CE539C3
MLKPGKRVSVGMIGLGGVGEKLLRTFILHPEIEVVAICDVDEQRIRRIASELGRVVWSTDYQELLNRAEPDLIYLAVPPKYHHPIALEVLRRKKHLLCEKPLANSLAEAQEMLQAAMESGVVHAMNFPTYYRKAWRELASQVASGRIGSVQKIEITANFPVWPRKWQQNQWIGGREQGGFVREVLPHFIHLTQKHFGPIVGVDASIDYPADAKLCETGIAGCLTLQDGTSVWINGGSGKTAQEQVAYTVHGTKGTLSLVNWGQLEYAATGEPLVPAEINPHDHLYELVTWVVRGIQGEPTDLISFQEGYQVQEILEQLLQGSAT